MSRHPSERERIIAFAMQADSEGQLQDIIETIRTIQVYRFPKAPKAKVARTRKKDKAAPVESAQPILPGSEGAMKASAGD